ncbi:MAG: efflux RND transporter periplasmic adaptor subunit [Gammaproteobacteria bacterium]|nr:efflux RND transporter periplasmic adaptor subunit [Gammaproteobacteria bacterium]
MALTAAARQALERSSPVVRGDDDGASGSMAHYGIACPLRVDGKLFGVVAVEASGAVEQQRAVMQLLQWGATWLEFLVQREASAVTGRLVSLVEVIAAGLEQPRFEAAATAAATELSRALACSRVSIGFVKAGRARLRAVSHTARFTGEASLVRAIEATMDEALDQGVLIVHPGDRAGPLRVTRAHEALAACPGSGSVCTVPFGDDRELHGAITLERVGDQGFDAPSVELCEAVAALAGPILESKRLEDRWLPAKIGDSVWTGLRQLFGPRYFRHKLVAVALTAIVAFLATATGRYQVIAPAAVESTVQRVVAAPRDGYLAQASVRAGDVVRQGQLMARLDTEELELERTRLVSEREQLAKEHREAFVTDSRARARILDARMSQVEAQLELIDVKLSRSRLTTPFDGVVVFGDLSQSLGAAVARGETLFQVAPLDAQRVVMEVDERDVSALREGQTGEIRLTALAQEALSVTVARVTPMSTAREGRNFFRVEARLHAADDGLRPGMQGIARIDVDERRLVWIWTHELLDWLRLQLWRWYP